MFFFDGVESEPIHDVCAQAYHMRKHYFRWLFGRALLIHCMRVASSAAPIESDELPRNAIMRSFNKRIKDYICLWPPLLHSKSCNVRLPTCTMA